MIKIACQTIVYGNSIIKDNMKNILKNIHDNGYDGVEIGARHFYMDKPDYYNELLKLNSLELPAIHVGGDFLNRDSINKQIENMGKTFEFARKLGCKYIYLSGVYKENKTEDDYFYEASIYEEIGKRSSGEGLILCYHNHNWEFENKSKGIKILLENTTSKNFKLVPDVGWVTIAGYDPIKFLNDNIDRVEAIHFKDFKAPNQFTELGNGIVDFKRIYEFIKDKKDYIWITAEQDEASGTPEESSKINCDYIASLIK